MDTTDCIATSLCESRVDDPVAQDQSYLEWMLAIAAAIADPTQTPIYLRLDENDHKVNDGFASSVREAVYSGRAFTLMTAGDVVVLDNDPDDGVSAADFLEEFPDLLEGLRPVLCASGRPYAFHVLIRCGSRLDCDEIVAAAKSFGIGDAQVGRWIRPPLSPHPNGLVRSEITNMSPAEALDALKPLGLAGPLGRKALRALEQGPAVGEDRSAVLMSAVLGMVVGEWDEDAMFDTLLVKPGGESLRVKTGEKHWSEDRTRQWFKKHTLKRARERVVMSPTPRSAADALLTVSRAQEWSRVHQWPGTGGNTDRIVLRYVLSKAEELHRSYDLGLSIRDVAEGAGVHHKTALNSLRRLQQVGIIQRLMRELAENRNEYQGPLANRYSISIPTLSSPAEELAWQLTPSSNHHVVHQSDPGGCEIATGATDDASDVRHDAFRTGGLGKATFLVFETLSDEPLLVTEIAKVLNKTPASIRPHLIKLEEYGAATRNGRLWTAKDVDLDALAVELGVDGLGDEQRVRHQADREKSRAKFGKADVRPTSVRFAQEMVRTELGSTVTENDILVRYWRWLLSLHGRGPEPMHPFGSSDPFDAIRQRHPTAFVSEMTGSSVWHNIGLVPRANLPLLPRLGPPLRFDD